MQNAQLSNHQVALQIPSLEIFNEQAASLDSYKIFFAYFSIIPSKISISNLNASLVRKYIIQQYDGDFIDIIYNKRYNWRTKKYDIEEIYYLLKDEILICVEEYHCCIFFSHQYEVQANKLNEKLKPYKIRKKSRKSISLIISCRRGLDTVNVHIKRPIINLQTHYNDDMIEMHQKLLLSLNKKNQSGLVLFHGLPGTGKSTYIKHLIYQVKKEVIFLPPRIAASMDNPDFSQFLVEHPNSVFVIEDAEELIVNQKGLRNSGMSMLLNLSDGLLGEGLGIQFIATFNTNIENIDAALLRKGRLNMMYEFKALEMKKARMLSEKITNKNRDILNAMTLAEIYHIESNTFNYQQERSQIGFMKELSA